MFLDLWHPNLVPLNDTVNQLVHTEEGGSVRDVMAGGKFRLRDGVVPGVDRRLPRRRAQQAAERLRAVNAARRELAERLAPHVERFCLGLKGAAYPPRMVPVGDVI